MQRRILFRVELRPRSAAKAACRRKEGPQNAPAPRQTKESAPCLRKTRRLMFILFPLEFRRSEKKSDELAGINRLSGLSGRRQRGLGQDLPRTRRDVSLQKRGGALVQDRIRFVEVD